MAGGRSPFGGAILAPAARVCLPGAPRPITGRPPRPLSCMRRPAHFVARSFVASLPACGPAGRCRPARREPWPRHPPRPHGPYSRPAFQGIYLASAGPAARRWRPVGETWEARRLGCARAGRLLGGPSSAPPALLGLPGAGPPGGSRGAPPGRGVAWRRRGRKRPLGRHSPPPGGPGPKRPTAASPKYGRGGARQSSGGAATLELGAGIHRHPAPGERRRGLTLQKE